MSVTLTGNRGARWTAARWVARNAARYLVPALQAEGCPDLASDAAEALAGDPPASERLGERLLDDAAAEAFGRAVAVALGGVRGDGPAGWRAPELFGPFAARFADLAQLGRLDGNVLVLEMAARPLEDRAGRVIGVAEALQRHL